LAAEKTDDEIMQDAASGDPGAFRAIVQKYYGRIFAVSYRIMNHYHDAQDITQETFTRAFASAGDFRSGGSAYRWLLRIAVNLCINEMRSARRRLTGRLEHETAAEGSTEEKARESEMEKEIRRAIHELPEAQRMAVVLAKFEGLSYREIAQMMGKSVSSVESLLVRARKTLLERLEKYAGSAGP
jgi:RNA polymerase sigma-70 factor (ECF subfamily)